MDVGKSAYRASVFYVGVKDRVMGWGMDIV